MIELYEQEEEITAQTHGMLLPDVELKIYPAWLSCSDS
jgi:hypothetical protein